MAKFGLYKIIRVQKEIEIHGKKVLLNWDALSRRMIILDWKDDENQKAEMQAADKLGWIVTQESIAFTNNPEQTTTCYIILNQDNKYVSQELALRITRGGQIIKTGSDKDF